MRNRHDSATLRARHANCTNASPHGIRLAIVLLAIALAACGGPQQNRPDRHPPADSRANALGYRAAHYTPGDTLTERWPSPQGEYDIAFSVPKESGPFPLVLYIPGIGDSIESGARWRLAMLEAGYAVLAIQPRGFGPSLLGSADARSGDFDALARQHANAKQFDAETAQARAALAELRQRAANGDVAYAHLDTRRWAVAGFAWGAAVALRLADSTIAGDQPSAVIALSPSLDLPVDALGPRLAGIRAPVLTITGHADRDPFLPSASAAFREEIHRRLPDGAHLLLMLDEGLHASLAGDTANAPAKTEAGNPAREASGAGNSRGHGRRGNRPGAGDVRPGAGFNGNASAAETVIVAGTSQAFLDANLRDSSDARRWLAHDAADSLAGYGVLASRARANGN